VGDRQNCKSQGNWLWAFDYFDAHTRGVNSENYESVLKNKFGLRQSHHKCAVHDTTCQYLFEPTTLAARFHSGVSVFYTICLRLSSDLAPTSIVPRVGFGLYPMHGGHIQNRLVSVL
jgi:hypothetical protein